jgi:hypothetical protein
MSRYIHGVDAGELPCRDIVLLHLNPPKKAAKQCSRGYAAALTSGRPGRYRYFI